jgi:hypothetical protein
LEQMRRLTTLNVARNRLTFQDIEPNLRIENFMYAPQDSVGRGGDTTGVVSLPFSMNGTVGGTLNLYQWFRRTAGAGGVGSVVESAVTMPSENPFLEFARFSEANAGTYFSRITNIRADGLTLVSRPVRVNSTLPPRPVGAPELVSPTNGATNLSRNPLLQWTRVANAADYDITVRLLDGTPVLSLSISAADGAVQANANVVTAAVNAEDLVGVRLNGLLSDTQYRWFVVARNITGVSRDTSARWVFRTAPAGTVVTMSSANFGRVALGDTAAIQVFVANVSDQAITLREPRIADNTDSTFQLLSALGGTTLTRGQEVGVTVRYVPRTIGTRQSTVTLLSVPTGSTATPREETLTNLYSGRGAPLQVLNTNFDTVRIGKTTLTTALVINRNQRGGAAAVVNLTELSDALGGVSGGVSTGELTFLGDRASAAVPLYIAAGDTSAILLRLQPRIEGRMRSTLRIASSIDTATAPVLAFARPEQNGDAAIDLGVGISRRNVVPGDTVTVTFFMKNLTSARRAAIINSRTRLEYEGRFRFGKSVLAVDTEQGGVYSSLTDPRNRVQSILLSRQAWTGASDVLARVVCRVVNGAVDSTLVEIEQFRWGGADARAFGKQRVFVETSDTTRFTAAVCDVGGKRLVRPASATTLSRARPNPSNGETLVAFTLREAGSITLTLHDAVGKLISTVLSATLSEGDHTKTVNTAALPSGTYFLRLATPTAVVRERLDVVR